jgi:hypothetical protein
MPRAAAEQAIKRLKAWGERIAAPAISRHSPIRGGGGGGVPTKTKFLNASVRPARWAAARREDNALFLAD